MGEINSFNDLAHLLRNKRKQMKLSQSEVAGLTGVGVRFLSELENGKETVEFGKVLKVIHGMGLQLVLNDEE